MNPNLLKQNSAFAVSVANLFWLTPTLPAATFSDADWVSLNPRLPGADSTVRVLAVDDSGNLYAGGECRVIGTALASGIAKWDGCKWSPLGSGMDYPVTALAVNGTNLYAGGEFETAGGLTVNHVAKWDGTAWSALGSGVSDGIDDVYNRPAVHAPAVTGSELYVAGCWTGSGTLYEYQTIKYSSAGVTCLPPPVPTPTPSPARDNSSD